MRPRCSRMVLRQIRVVEILPFLCTEYRSLVLRPGVEIFVVARGYDTHAFVLR